MLLNGFNHVAIITKNTERFVDFYRRMFDAEVDGQVDEMPGGTLTFVRVGNGIEINLFEIEGNSEADRQVPMFGRGRIDHIGLHAANLEAFDTARSRLMEEGATDGFVTDLVCSSPTPTDSRVRCAYPTPMRSPA